MASGSTPFGRRRPTRRLAVAVAGGGGTRWGWLEESPFLLRPSVAGMTGAHHHAPRLLFLFSGGMGFRHVGQAGLELLTSSDPPSWASQSAGMTGVSRQHFTLEEQARGRGAVAHARHPIALWEAQEGGSLEVRSSSETSVANLMKPRLY